MPSVYLKGQLYSFTFVNDLNEEVSAYWINYKGKKKHYFTLEPKEEIEQLAYKGHRWVLEDQNGNDIFSFQAGFGQFDKMKHSFEVSSLVDEDEIGILSI